MTDDDWTPTVPITDDSSTSDTTAGDDRPGSAVGGGRSATDDENGHRTADEENGQRPADEENGQRTADDESGQEEVEPVEVLVQLAEDGEIDPWDIDIVSVTDAFLAELDETDLRTSGRALFYASVLLRMKADVMVGEDEPADEEEETWDEFRADGELAGQNDPDFDPVDALEAEMDRRLERKSARGTPETLDELVRELRDAERDSWWKRSREYDTTGSEPTSRQTVSYRGTDERRPDESDAAEATARTHEEDIETLIDEVHTRLSRQYEQGRTEVLFRELRDIGPSPIRTYLAVLFLSHRGHVRLQQDDLFGDLWIRDPAAPTVGDEAVAD